VGHSREFAKVGLGTTDCSAIIVYFNVNEVVFMNLTRKRGKFFNYITIESKRVCESGAHDMYCNVNRKTFFVVAYIYLYIHSINKHITSIYTFLENILADVIAVSETRLTDDSKIINILGCHFEYRYRIDGVEGGIWTVNQR